MKLLKFAFAAAVAAVVAAPTAFAQEMELKLGHVAAPGSLFDTVTKEFAKRVNDKLAGKAKVVVFGSSQLGNDKELLQKLKLGTVDFSIPSTIMSSVTPEFGVFEMPYLVKNRDHMKRIEEEILWPTMAPAAEAKGYKILAVWENGFRHITNNVRPINKPEDLKGLKLRTPKGAWRVKMFKAYGANPSPMAFSEVFTALKTGVMDGQENPFAQIYSAKFQEVQKYLSLTGHVYTPAYLLVGKDRWEQLPEDVRTQIEAIAKETQAFVYETAAKLEEDLLTKLKEGGIAVNEADKDAFIAGSKAIYDEFATEVPGGKELVDKAISLGTGS
jgi:tripartite ATP-independent transporter DctP family solute receptor